MYNKILFILLIAFSTLFSTTVLQAQNFKIDTKKSTVIWEGKKVTGAHNGDISFKEGTFYVLDGTISYGDFIVDMNSITCSDISDPKTNDKLLGHLKSDDFFGVESFPEAHLAITSGSHKEMNTHQFTGKITIKGITQPINFDAELVVFGSTIQAKARITIDRTKFDIKYGSGSFFSKLGDKAIYDDFTLTINLVAEPEN